MVKLTLIDGKKGEGDILVLIEANNEPFGLHELLFILKCIFDSEDSYYPISNGFRGKAMLASAIVELICGVPLEDVLKRYGLSSSFRIVDKRKKGN